MSDPVIEPPLDLDELKFLMAAPWNAQLGIAPLVRQLIAEVERLRSLALRSAEEPPTKKCTCSNNFANPEPFCAVHDLPAPAPSGGDPALPGAVELKSCHCPAGRGENCPLTPAQCEARTRPLDPATERALREYLWLSHGHHGQYGDDGEMQCGECAPLWDYKRSPLDEVIRQARKAREEVNIKALLAAQNAERAVLPGGELVAEALAECEKSLHWIDREAFTVDYQAINRGAGGLERVVEHSTAMHALLFVRQKVRALAAPSVPARDVPAPASASRGQTVVCSSCGDENPIELLTCGSCRADLQYAKERAALPGGEPAPISAAIAALKAFADEEVTNAIRTKDRDQHQFYQGWNAALERVANLVAAPGGDTGVPRAFHSVQHELLSALGLTPDATVASVQRRLHVGVADAMRLLGLREWIRSQPGGDPGVPRLWELAVSQARDDHDFFFEGSTTMLPPRDKGGHVQPFDTCPHPDCVLVRSQPDNTTEVSHAGDRRHD